MIRERLNAVYDGLPVGLRRRITPLAESGDALLKRAVSLPAQRHQGAYLFTGVEKDSGASLTVLFSGRLPTMHYFSRRIFSGNPRIHELGRRPLRRLQKTGRAETAQADLVLVECDAFWTSSLRRHGYMILPQWVFFELDISRPLPELLQRISNKSLKSNLARVKKAGFTCSVTAIDEGWRSFYRRMYLPYAKMRYGNASIVYTQRQYHRAFETGRLLMVHDREGKKIAGVLLVPWRRYLRFHSLGVLDAEPDYLAKGVITALYYFGIMWGLRHGYRRMDFGHCRPCLDDGLFLYKKRWGMSVRRSPRVKAVIGIRALTRGPALKSLARRMEPVFLNGGRLEAVVCARHHRPLDPAEVRRLSRRHINGLDRLHLLAPGGFSREAMQAVETDGGSRISLVKGEPETMLVNAGEWTRSR